MMSQIRWSSTRVGLIAGSVSLALLATTMPAYAGTPQEVVAQDTAEAAPPATDPVAAALAEAKSSGKPVAMQTARAADKVLPVVQLPRWRQFRFRRIR